MTPKKLLDIFGIRQASIRKPVGGSQQATVAITVTASKKMLQEVVVFKGKGKAPRIWKEITKYAELFGGNGVYTTQANAWMDEGVMFLWAQDVLKLYVSLAPRRVHPVLLLDSYRCHLMASVVSQIEALGVTVLHIPPSYRPLCQPINIGVCKPVKTKVKFS